MFSLKSRLEKQQNMCFTEGYCASNFPKIIAQKIHQKYTLQKKKSPLWKEGKKSTNTYSQHQPSSGILQSSLLMRTTCDS